MAPRAIVCCAALLCASLFTACMQTTMPATTAVRTLVATAVLKPAGNSASPGTPLPGVDVNLHDTDPANATAAPLHNVTDVSGTAVFKVEIPVAGKAYDISAQYLNTIQRVPSILLCVDTVIHFVFDTTTPQTISCATLNAKDTLIFLNEQGDTTLGQNMPLGMARYERCWSITNAVGAASAVSITLASVAAPFSVAAAYVNGAAVSIIGTVALSPGSTLSLCFDVSTSDTGMFLQTIFLPVKCPSSQGTISLTLKVHVVQPPCVCKGVDITLPHSTRVHIGDSAQYVDQVFTNELSCPVIVDFISFNGLDGLQAWKIVAPKFPVTVQPGGKLSVTSRFVPKGAGATEDTLVLKFTPLNGIPCALNVILQGAGCDEICPTIDRHGVDVVFGSNGIISDTLFNPLHPVSNRIQVSIFSVNPKIQNVVDTAYQIRLVDTACNSITVVIEQSYPDTSSARFFTKAPTNIVLQPGDKQQIPIEFTGVDIADFRAIVARRQSVGAPHPITADSAFTVILKLRTSKGCVQEIHVTVVLTPYPDLSPIINLRAYSQRTPEMALPEDEVFTFGTGGRISLRTLQGDGPYPPTQGDIYINVSDTTPAGVPPLPPILYLRTDRFTGMKLWKTGFLEADFDIVAQTVQQFFATPGYDIGYLPTPISPLTPGEVYAFQYLNGGSATYALMYIRAVQNGTENNTNKQSAIEFRSIYPVVQP